MKFGRILRSLFRRRQQEAEMQAEMRHHLELQAERNRAEGMEAEEARYAAERQFGNVASLQEQAREGRGWRWLEELAHDLRLAARRLRKSPGFTAGALLTLALGIGVNTAMFAVLHVIVLRTLPYPDGSQLVRVFRTSPQGDGFGHSPANFLDLRDQNTVLAHTTACQFASWNLAESGQPAERLRGLVVTADFFPVFGVAPALGRTFGAKEDQPGAQRVVVLSHELWSGRFAGDPAIIGREVRLDGQPVTVIGVMPPGFNDPLLFGQIDAWRPLALTGAQRATRRSGWLAVFARLKPDVSLAHAQAAIHALGDQLALAWPDPNAHTGLKVAPLSHGSQMIDPDGNITWFVSGLAAAVLLIACVNLANLQFARTAARARELAVRAALGASRGRLLREVLAEALLLALVGGLLGVLVAQGCNHAVGSRLTFGNHAGLALPIDVRAIAFSLLLSAGTGVAFGLLPAWFGSRTDVNDALKPGARGLTAGRGLHRLRHTLIVVEMALALVLLASAAFFIGGLQRLMGRDPGWHREGLLIAEVNIGATTDARAGREGLDAHRVAVAAQWEERLAGIPGVERVAYARRLPTWGYGSTAHFAIDGRPDAPPGREPYAFTAPVSGGFFATLGLRLVEGRAFTAADRAGTLPVTIINLAMARALWPGESPIGRRIGSPDPANRQWREIVGVVADTHPISMQAIPTPYQVYRPWAQAPEESLTLALRVGVPQPGADDGPMAKGALADELRRAALEIEPSQPVHSITWVSDEIDQVFSNLNLAGRLLAGFALLGVLLAGLGTYAVIANSVVQRTQEIGVRVALGAQVRDVLVLVVGRGLQLALLGCAFGLAGAVAIARLLAALLPGVPPGNLPAAVGVTGLLLVVAVLACWLPARRAARVDPVVALRSE